jgi:hypothetical protein
MAQSSTTISSQKDHKVNITGTDISFTASSKTISATSTNLSNLAVRDLITIAGTANNNSTFTVKSVATNGLSITVEETVTTEASGASVTIDYTGFVTDKYQGDGYYSQADGVHTVAYHVLSTLTGSVKMQGSLATTPTESDWFDIADTTFTTDQSTTIFSANFTGNFVWVRAKTTGTTAGSVTKILYNH